MNIKQKHLFEIGEVVRYRGRSTPATIIKRKFVKDHYLSGVWDRPVYISIYITEETKNVGLRDRTRTFKWEDPEALLETADITPPEGAVDYESDEFTGDWLDANGKILKTVKCGTPGRAHEIVSEPPRKAVRVRR